MSELTNQALSRRGFLKAMAAIAITAAAVNPVAAFAEANNHGQILHADNFWDYPREIHLIRAATGEHIREVYWQNGQISEAGYRRICWLLRDVHEGQAVYMNVGLMNLMRATQGWLQMNGIDEPIIINSGYRTRRTNEGTEGSARNSMHLYGAAADIIMPGIPADYLSRLAIAFQAGGVGFYQRKNFVHIDTGRQRIWRG